MDNITKLKEAFAGEEYDELSAEPRRLIRKISGHICAVTKKVDEMVEARKKANRIADTREKAIAYHDTVAPYLDEIRDHIDDLELMVDNQMWHPRPHRRPGADGRQPDVATAQIPGAVVYPIKEKGREIRAPFL